MTTKNWANIEELVREFGLEHLLPNRPELRSEVRRRLAAAHPDAFGGAFPDEEHSAAYRRLESALDFLDSEPAMTLVPKEQMQIALATMTEQIERLRKAKEREDVNALKSTAKEYSRRRILFPRITSGAFLALCSIILSFPGQVIEHPFGQVLLPRSDYRRALTEFRLYREYARKQLTDTTTEKAGTPKPILTASPDSTAVPTASGANTSSAETAVDQKNATGPVPNTKTTVTPVPSQTPSATIGPPRQLSEQELLEKIASSYGLLTVPKDGEALRSAIDEAEKKYQERRLITYCWPLLFLSASAFAWTWYRENKIKVAVEVLGSEAALHEIFERLTYLGFPHSTFTFRDLVDLVGDGIAGAPPLPDTVAEQVSATIVDRLLARNAILRAPPRGVDECFVVPQPSK